MKKLLFSLYLVLQFLNTWAQPNQEIRGNIIDSKSLQPIPIVVVSILGINQLEHTTTAGSFVFNHVPKGYHPLVISATGYLSKTLLIEVLTDHIDLGNITLDEDSTADTLLNLITLTADEIEDTTLGAESTPALLQSSREVFDQSAAFNWAQARFKVRGLDSKYAITTINGVVMNKLHDGRPQWSNWGGLSDVTRNQEFSSGSIPTDYAFGGILGTQTILTRASHFHRGSRITFSTSNTSYIWKPTIAFNSGINNRGWSYTLSASYRDANEAYFDGTNYTAKSLFIAIDKRFSNRHNFNFTGIYAQNKRGKSAPLTDEIANLMGFKYNPYWGWQVNDKRNSRYKEVEEPIFMLNHYWIFDAKNRLTTSIAYQFGKIGDSRLGFNGVNNPDPTYYRNLPSYYLGYHDRDGHFLGNTESNLTNAARNRAYFLNNSQINWSSIYHDNTINERSRIILYEDRNDDQSFSFNALLNSDLSEHVSLNTVVNYRKLHSENFSVLTDLLGGSSYNDVNHYYTNNSYQTDLNNPNRLINLGDRFGYNYNLKANLLDVSAQFKFSCKLFNFYLAQNFNHTTYQREGLYKNGIYPSYSYGKSTKVDFNTFGFKTGFTYQLSGRHTIHANAALINQAPTLRNVFSNARLNNMVTPYLQSETIFNIDGSYILRIPKLKTRITAYLTEIKKATDISFYYAEGIGVLNEEGHLLDNNGDAFVSEILTGINSRHLGLEFGTAYHITPNIQATLSMGFGQAFYTNNPNISLNIDKVARTENYGSAYLKNYRIASGPQTAMSLGLEYRDPKFWWISANGNYLDHSYIHIAPILRTDNFVINPEDPNLNPFNDLTESGIKSLLKQEQLKSLLLFNINGGKSWRINRNTFRFFGSVNNLFDLTYKTSGFEQARNANYAQLTKDHTSPIRAFGNKYYYGFGRNFFINANYNF